MVSWPENDFGATVTFVFEQIVSVWPLLQVERMGDDRLRLNVSIMDVIQ